MITSRARSRLSRTVRLIKNLMDLRGWISFTRLVNHYQYDHVQPRREIDKRAGVRISPTASFRNGSKISIGTDTRIGDGVRIWAGKENGAVIIGEQCSFGPGVFVTAANYELEPGIAVMSQKMKEEVVTIGSRCWLGAHCIVLPGVSLGTDVVIAAGSVVTKDIPDGAVAAGVPARTLHYRSTSNK